MSKVAVSKEFYLRVKNSTSSTGVKSPGLKLRVRNEKLILRPLKQNICCGYSRKLSQ